MDEWFADERFWQDLEEVVFSSERKARAPEEVSGVLALAGHQGRDVLDLCCGPGRHAVELAGRGYRVVGVDRSPFLLGRARTAAERAAVAVEWVESDMRTFRRPGAFDLIVNLFTSFGYFEDRADDLAVLQGAFDSLRSGGRFVLDLTGKEVLASGFEPTISEPLEGGGFFVQRRAVLDGWDRLENELTVVRDGRAVTHRFGLTLYSARELRDRLVGVGFERVGIYGSLAGGPYTAAPERLVAVAWKAAAGGGDSG